MRSFLKNVKTKICRTSPTSVYLAQTMKNEILRYGWEIGDYNYGTPVILGIGTASLSIGRYTSIAQNVLIILDGHNINHTSTYPFAHIDRNGFVKTDEILSPHSKSRQISPSEVMCILVLRPSFCLESQLVTVQ